MPNLTISTDLGGLQHLTEDTTNIRLAADLRNIWSWDNKECLPLLFSNSFVHYNWIVVDQDAINQTNLTMRTLIQLASFDQKSWKTRLFFLWERFNMKTLTYCIDCFILEWERRAVGRKLGEKRGSLKNGINATLSPSH